MATTMNKNTAAEIVARLNPTISRFDMGLGGIPVYTQDVIGMALGMVDAESKRLWIRVIYAGHQQYLSDLKREILILVVNEAAPELWQIEKPGTLQSLIDLAIAEVSHNKICTRCNGQKSITLTSVQATALNNPVAGLYRAGQTVTCPSCEGVGYKSMSHKEYARQAGIHHELWKRHWRGRYHRIVSIIHALDYDAKVALAKVLS